VPSTSSCMRRLTLGIGDGVNQRWSLAMILVSLSIWYTVHVEGSMRSARSSISGNARGLFNAISLIMRFTVTSASKVPPSAHGPGPRHHAQNDLV
jgi:hypothetical protein